MPSHPAPALRCGLTLVTALPPGARRVRLAPTPTGVRPAAPTARDRVRCALAAAGLVAR